ncbi:helix-turn-helix domain-containing protein, partial [Klebsiella pneumoniae]|uniref:helix-turn-helix domain-containing protein n=1 Tax=Klebsiella pneumoniae TaxID=573 RepID=UPI003D29551D
MATDTPRIPEQGVATLPDEAWERARRRAEIISPLAQSETVGHEAADMAAQALGLSRRQVYVLIRRARQGSGLVTDLVPGQSGGGKGKGRGTVAKLAMRQPFVLFKGLTFQKLCLP